MKRDMISQEEFSALYFDAVRAAHDTPEPAPRPEPRRVREHARPNHGRRILPQAIRVVLDLSSPDLYAYACRLAAFERHMAAHA